MPKSKKRGSPRRRPNNRPTAPDAVFDAALREGFNSHRREGAPSDAAILAAAGASDDDMDALAEHAAGIPLTDLD